MAVIFPAHYLFVNIENEVVKILKMLNFDISCIHCWMSGIVQSARTHVHILSLLKGFLNLSS